jgi:hypothetical protein
MNTLFSPLLRLSSKIDGNADTFVVQRQADGSDLYRPIYLGEGG